MTPNRCLLEMSIQLFNGKNKNVFFFIYALTLWSPVGSKGEVSKVKSHWTSMDDYNAPRNKIWERKTRIKKKSVPCPFKTCAVIALHNFLPFLDLNNVCPHTSLPDLSAIHLDKSIRKVTRYFPFSFLDVGDRGSPHLPMLYSSKQLFICYPSSSLFWHSFRKKN